MTIAFAQVAQPGVCVVPVRIESGYHWWISMNVDEITLFVVSWAVYVLAALDSILLCDRGMMIVLRICNLNWLATRRTAERFVVSTNALRVAIVRRKLAPNSAKLQAMLQNCFVRRHDHGKTLEIREPQLRNFCAQTLKRKE